MIAYQNRRFSIFQEINLCNYSFWIFAINPWGSCTSRNNFSHCAVLRMQPVGGQVRQELCCWCHIVLAASLFQHTRNDNKHYWQNARSTHREHTTLTSLKSSRVRAPHIRDLKESFLGKNLVDLECAALRALIFNIHVVCCGLLHQWDFISISSRWCDGWKWNYSKRSGACFVRSAVREHSLVVMCALHSCGRHADERNQMQKGCIGKSCTKSKDSPQFIQFKECSPVARNGLP